MRRKIMLMSISLAVGLAFGLTGLLIAADAPTQDIKISSPGATRPLIVQFSHEKHKASKCEECHHAYKPNDKGEYPKNQKGDYDKLPESTYKTGDAVKKCHECHKLEGDKKKMKEMRIAANQIRSLEDAFHDNCVTCHKEINKKEKREGKNKLSNNCNDCHEKEKK